MAWPKRDDIPQEIRELHRESTVIDLHGDTFFWSKLLRYNIGKRHRNRLPLSPFCWHIDLPRMADAGCDGQVFGLVVRPYRNPEKRWWVAHGMFDEMHIGLRKHSKKIGLARNTREFEDLRKKGKFAALIGVEGGHCLGGRVEAVEEFKKRGASYMSIAHLSNNEACYANKDIKKRDRGLTGFGFQVVEEIDRKNVIFDMSHINEPGFFDIIGHRKGKGPVIASHTGVKGIHNHWRNLSDDMVRAIADTDGCIGIMYHAPFITNSIFADLNHVVAHYVYVKKLVGARYLALGSDFDGFIFNPKGIRGIEDLPVLTMALLRAGFTEQEIMGILGNNFMRVFREICG